MKLNPDYLKQRHEFWKNKIGEAGIWNPGSFLPVAIIVKKASRRYNGMFQRRTKRLKDGLRHYDKIVIYNNAEEFKPEFIDSVLVHEMIHQYIFQAEIKDTSTHGKTFRLLMARINHSFPGELDIRISTHNPSVPETGIGTTMHYLLVFQTPDHSWLCVIHPSKVKEFDRKIKSMAPSLRIKNYAWCKSYDVYFNRFTRCTRVLHGQKKSLEEMKEFCRLHQVTPL